jgi:hypothetical protein
VTLFAVPAVFAAVEHDHGAHGADGHDHSGSAETGSPGADHHEGLGHSGGAGAEHAAHAAPVTPELQGQIDRIHRAASKYPTPEDARAAGYAPFFGTPPTMGSHWINQDFVDDGVVDPERPESLQYSPVLGEERLVAVSFIVPAAPDEPEPAGLIGAEGHWHRHDAGADPRAQLLFGSPGNRNPAQQSFFDALGGDRGVYMTHVWFVPAIDGPFTDHNPYLPFLGNGLAPPSAEVASEHRQLVSEAAMGLAELYSWPTGPIWGDIRSVNAADVAGHHQNMRALLPQLATALATGEDATVLRGLETLASEWKATMAVYEADMTALQRAIITESNDRSLQGHMHS